MTKHKHGWMLVEAVVYLSQTEHQLVADNSHQLSSIRTLFNKVWGQGV